MKSVVASDTIDYCYNVFICIFVVESKNYSGWIFGNEKSFYNPIMQNKTHIKWLKKQVGNNIPVYSVIAFSERCKLKDITVESKDVKVIKMQIS